MKTIEQKAVDLALKGVSHADIESELGYEFIFFRTGLDNKIHHATILRPLCKTCFIH